MKKLLLTGIAILGLAICAEAASVDWASAGIQTTGDFDEGTGDYAAGYAVYLFSNAGTYTQAAMATAIAANNGWADAFAATSAAYLGVTTADADGAISPLAVTVADGDFSGYLVIFDDADYTKAKYAFVSETYTATDNAVHKMALDYDGDTWVNALDYSTAGQTGSNWHAVPEPTSGLLMLLGMAGLALRRRRA